MEKMDGQFRWFRDFMYLVKGAEGEAKLLRGIMVDMTESKEAELALQASEERYRAFLANSSEGIWRIEIDRPISIALPVEEQIGQIFQFGYLAECNDALAWQYGFDRAEEIIGHRAKDLISHDPHNIDNLRAFVRSGYRVEGAEVLGKDRQGKVRHFLSTYFGVVENGHLVRAWGVRRDITERKKAEEALAESQALLNSIVNTTSDMIWSVDAKSLALLSFNQSFVEFFLRRFGIRVNKGVLPEDLLPTADLRRHWHELYQRALREGSYTVEYDMKMAPRTLQLSFNVLTRAGVVFAVSVFAKDITERKRAEAELADRLRFETLVAELSARFVNVPTEQLGDEIEEAQRHVCECLGLEACSLWLASVEAPNLVTLTHLYRMLEGLPPAVRMNVEEHFPWCHQQILAGKVVAVSSLGELPGEAARDQESWRQFGVKTALVMGLAVGGGPPVAVLSFNTMRAERTWPEEIVNRLQLVAQIFSNALARQRSDRILRESEERFRAIFQGAAEGIVVSDFGTRRVVYANPTVRRMLGYTEEELAHMGVSDLHRPEDMEKVEAGYMAQTRGERTSASAIPCLCKDGTTIYADINASRLEVGGKDYCVAFFTDITARKAAEEALRESEERFRGLSNASLEGIMIHDQGLILDANMAFARLFGYEQPEELIGKYGVDFIIAPESRVTILKRMQEKGTEPLELACLRKDGTTFSGETDSRSVRYLGHNASVVSCRDITERKRAEEALRRSLEQLRALAARLQNIREEERKRVAREIHDQLGQALTAIKLDLSSLVRDLPAKLNHLAKRSSPILHLVDEAIQTVRRISTELRPGMLDDLGLVATIEWAAEAFEGRTGTKCRLDLPREEIAIDPTVATAVFRIFQETLTNVARHASASEVEVRLAKIDNDLILEVLDNGKGFAEASLSSGESLGILGMRERALLFGGELEISSASGEGTKVRVRIPACAGPIEATS
jgi:PAS domain S-box-containing protein